MTAHTEGPYTYRPSDDDDAWEIVAPFAESPLALVPFWPDESGLASAEAEANARLFAAAPKLLEFAHAMLGFDIATPKDYATKGAEAFSPLARHLIDLQNQARNVIAEATGRAA